MNYKNITVICLLATSLIGVSCAEDQNVISPNAPEGILSVIMEEGVPGGVVLGAVEVSATVKKIDYEARTLLLLGADGEEMPITAGPEVINFKQIKQGDTVTAVVAKELMIYVSDDANAADDGMEAVAAAAAENSMPGAMVAGTVRITGTVTAIDAEAQTATIAFEDGSSRTVPVREDIDLSKQKVGSKVVFEVTKMVALTVEKL